MLKISIITVCLNAERFIEQTILSVLNQEKCNIEYILVDGGSTDGTLDIIKRYDANIDYWLSEPDKGVADAMNKGERLATGNYVLFLHADDYLFSTSVVSEALTYMDVDVDVHAFDVLYKTKKNEVRKQTKPFGLLTCFKTPVMHQGAFCKKALFKKIGRFDTNFKIAMDYDFFLRAFNAGATIKVNHHLLSVMRDTGISSRQDWASLKQRFTEEKRVHEASSPKFFMLIITITLI